MRFRTAMLALAVVSLASTVAIHAQATVAQTPPMGWNSWNFFATKVTDKDIRGAADQLVATGMKDAGYSTSTSTTAGRPSATPAACYIPIPNSQT